MSGTLSLHKCDRKSLHVEKHIHTRADGTQFVDISIYLVSNGAHFDIVLMSDDLEFDLPGTVVMARPEKDGAA
jgi:hypothetical protein